MSGDVYEVNGVIVNADTGEIIESDGDPIERIIAAGLEAKQQIKIWENYHNAMRAAAGGLLPEARPRAETVTGIAKRISFPRRSAKVAEIPRIAADFELSREQVTRIYECARELDPKLIDELVEKHEIPGQVADLLITISQVSYVQFDAVRKMAPAPRTREAVEA